MSLTRSLCLGLMLAIGLSLEAQTNVPQTLAQLQARLAQHVSQPKFLAGTFGVKIVSAKTGAVIFENDAQELLSPASNAKLYTVALALDRLGPDYRIRTSLYSSAEPRDGRLPGDLIIYGRGDPTIHPRIHGSFAKAMQPFIAALTNVGVREIEGDLIADESFFRGSDIGSGWAWDDLDYYYGARISSLTINDNLAVLSIKPAQAAGQPCRLEWMPPTVSLVLSNRTMTVAAGGKRSIRLQKAREGTLLYVSGQLPADDKGYTEDVTLGEPAGLFLEEFKQALTRNRIELKGTARVVTWLDRGADALDVSKLVDLGGMDSLPMADIAREVQKPSQNLYTDLLLAHVGEKTRATAGAGPNETSEELGIRELRKFLGEVGVKREDVHFEEGSGLSRNNLTTANATVALLLHMSHHPSAEAYWRALPVAGVDGTLRNRLKDTAAVGNLRAKTGTLRWASSLSGDVKTAAGDRLIFSLMLNRYQSPDPARSSRNELDAIAVMMAEFNGKLEE